MKIIRVPMMGYNMGGSVPGEMMIHSEDIRLAGVAKRPSLLAWLMLGFIHNQAHWNVYWATEGIEEKTDDNGESKKLLELLVSNPLWFPCPASIIKQELGINNQQQRSLFKELKEKGWIKTKRVGLPGRRWVKFLNPERISNGKATR